MSFGPSQSAKTALGPSEEAKTALKQQQQLSNLSASRSNTLFNLGGQMNTLGTGALGAGQDILRSGGADVTQGANYFRTLLGGNQANTAAALTPDIARIRGANQNTLQAVSTLMPRGGGRSSTLFDAAYAPNQQISNLFNTARSGAATNLANIGTAQQGVGLQQQGVGTNLFNLGNQFLGTGNQALGLGLQGNQGITSYDIANRAPLLSYDIANRNASNSGWAGLGGGLFNLFTTPFGGGGNSILDKIIGLF